MTQDLVTTTVCLGRVSISTCYVCLAFYVCHSAFYAAGRSRTGHLTSTRPDRQPTPVDPTGFHLWTTIGEEDSASFTGYYWTTRGNRL